MKNEMDLWSRFFVVILLTLMVSCNNDDDVSDDIDDVTDDITDDITDDADDGGNDDDNVVFILIDEESIDNGNEPNDFSETDVNDDISEIGQREELQYFTDNLNDTITLYTGQVGDEGWFALSNIPESWAAVGPTENGLRNFLEAGPGLGGGEDDDLLDEVHHVIPLRATSLAMLTGQSVIAVVYDSDISINYDPITGNLQGENLGIVAFEVIDVTERQDGSDSDLPAVRIKIMEAPVFAEYILNLFTNPDIPESSSEPDDVTPPDDIPEIELEATE
ncbi:MAG TPA: hypothetical protein VLO29_05405 [Salegentibacter sp.]|nr:hypothetical protein [Salegentibacter sp.]